MKTHYEVLGLKKKNASLEEIKKAYSARLLEALTLGSDGVSAGSDDAPTKEAVQIAYTTLSDPVKRAEYDKTLVEDDAHPVEDFKEIFSEPSPYHPALPTIDEAKQNYELVTSDHIPYLVTIPWTENKKTPVIKIVSWNALEGDAYNGFAPLGQSTCGETDALRNERHDRIAASVEKFVTNNHPHFITLQEISGNDPRKVGQNALYIKVKEKLGDDWACIEIDNDVADGGGCITLYNTTQFKPVIPVDAKTVRTLEHYPLSGNVTEYKAINNSRFTVKILNSHAAFKITPEYHEKHIREFLQASDDKKTKAVVIGDFNYTVAPTETTLQNTTTNVAPSVFRNNEIQGACAIDGCFYSEGTATCKQAKIEHLNPNTGNIYSAEDLAPADVRTLDEKQANEIKTFRMIMCVDDLYASENLIANEQTIFAYEASLRQQLQDDKILVRCARNLNNENGIGIVLNKAVYQFLGQIKDPSLQLSIVDNPEDGQHLYLVFTGTAHVPKLTQAISLAISLAIFSQKIAALEATKQAGMEDVIANLKGLVKAINEDNNAAANSSYPEVIEHFTQLTDDLCTKKMTIKEIEKSSRQLDESLYGKSPMSSAVKAVICGIIGAVVGFVIGAAVGGAITSWGFGFGAIPGAILGAVKGFTLGTAVGLGTAGVFAAGAGTAGFFHGRSKQAGYNAEHALIEAAELASINEPIKKVYASLKPR